MNTLGEFIQNYIKEHNTTLRELSEKLTIYTHATLSKYSWYGIKETYSGRKIGEPDLSFLADLAQATNTDLCTLVAILHPNATKTNPRARLIGDRISRLPADKLQLFDTFLKGLGLDNIQGS